MGIQVSDSESDSETETDEDVSFGADLDMLPSSKVVMPSFDYLMMLLITGLKWYQMLKSKVDVSTCIILTTCKRTWIAFTPTC